MHKEVKPKLMSTDEKYIELMVDVQQDGKYGALHCNAWRKDANWGATNVLSDLCCTQCHYKEHVGFALRRIKKTAILKGQEVTSVKSYVVCCRVKTFCLKASVQS